MATPNTESGRELISRGQRSLNDDEFSEDLEWDDEEGEWWTLHCPLNCRALMYISALISTLKSSGSNIKGGGGVKRAAKFKQREQPYH